MPTILVRIGVISREREKVLNYYSPSSEWKIFILGISSSKIRLYKAEFDDLYMLFIIACLKIRLIPRNECIP